MLATFRTLEHLSEMFWVSGLVLLHILGANRWVHLDQEAKEWASYLLLGTLFPTLVLLVSAFRHPGRTLSLLIRGLKLVLAGAFLVISIQYLAQHATSATLWISSIQTLLLLVMLASRRKLSRHLFQEALMPETAALALGGALVLALAWTIVGSIVYWHPLGEMITDSPYSFAVFSSALGVVSWMLFLHPKSVTESRSSLLWASSLAGALVIALFAFSLASIFSWDPSFEHWAWAAGPAQLVREGGWLLWDVHATYGFLNTLAVALFPAQSTWQSLYAVNSSLLFLSSLFIFLLFRALGRGLVSFATALSVAVSAVILMPGNAKFLTGAQVYPSVGPFRFLWCFVLLGVLFWNYSHAEMKNRLRRVAWTGCLPDSLGVVR
jgi:hypothetical protein